MSGTRDTKYTFRRCRGGDSFPESAECQGWGCNYKTMPRKMELWDRQLLPTAACWGGPAHRRPLTTHKPPRPPPILKKREEKKDTFHVSSLLFIVFWFEGAIYSPLFCFTPGFVQSPSQHNVRVSTQGRGSESWTWHSFSCISWVRQAQNLVLCERKRNPTVCAQSEIFIQLSKLVRTAGDGFNTLLILLLIYWIYMKEIIHQNVA